MQGIALLGVFLPRPFRGGELPKRVFASVEKALEKYFGKRGRAVIEANLKAVERRLPRRAGGSIPREDPTDEIAGRTGFAPGACEPFGCVLAAYASGTEEDLEADVESARSLIPAGSAARRDFVHLAPEIPELAPAACVGCMECVAACPDSAILAKVALPTCSTGRSAAKTDAAQRDHVRSQFVVTQKFHALPEKKGEQGGLFGLAIDPTKCKGCGECVEVCGSHAGAAAWSRSRRRSSTRATARRGSARAPADSARFLSEKALGD
jgi:ferredoxin